MGGLKIDFFSPPIFMSFSVTIVGEERIYMKLCKLEIKILIDIYNNETSAKKAKSKIKETNIRLIM